MKRNGGFTLTELLVVVVIIATLVLCVPFCLGVMCGNFWYSEDGVLRELKADHPNVTEIIRSKRNIFKKSVITVRENGNNKYYLLDTSIMWNYKFSQYPK